MNETAALNQGDQNYVERTPPAPFSSTILFPHVYLMEGIEFTQAPKLDRGEGDRTLSAREWSGLNLAQTGVHFLDRPLSSPLRGILMPGSATRQPAARPLPHELLGAEQGLQVFTDVLDTWPRTAAAHRLNSEIMAGQQISGTN